MIIGLETSESRGVHLTGSNHLERAKQDLIRAVAFKCMTPWLVVRWPLFFFFFSQGAASMASMGSDLSKDSAGCQERRVEKAG